MPNKSKNQSTHENLCLKQETIEKLVDELMKDRPNQKIVKDLSRQLSIPYSSDSVTQMNTILMNLNRTDSMEI